jgi:glucose/arabinose dehydrogenase
MMKGTIGVVISAVLLAGVTACGDQASLPLLAGFGPNPTLPPPTHTLFPTINIARAKGWAAGEAPTAAPGFSVSLFADSFEHPRNVLVLPNGDVLVAETNAPPRPEDTRGIRGLIARLVMAWAGAGGESANRITLLRADGAGEVKMRTTFLEGLNSPFGMALVGHDFYVANTDAVLRFPYDDGATTIPAPGIKVTDLPGGLLNHHWTKNLVASADGKRLYVSIGSNSNVGENGMDQEEGRAAIWEIDLATGQHRVYASGLRNPNGLAIEPETGQLWTAVNERDELGSDLVPDYMTAVKENGFYGWPYSYYGQHVDTRVEPQRPELVANAIVPDYALGAHTASLALAFASPDTLPVPFLHGVFVSQHGSWNRRPHSGYRLIFVPFAAGRPTGPPIEVLTGFLNDDHEARGRPVGIALTPDGSVLVADDVGNRIWRLAASPKAHRQISLAQ